MDRGKEEVEPSGDIEEDLTKEYLTCTTSELSQYCVTLDNSDNEQSLDIEVSWCSQ